MKLNCFALFGLASSVFGFGLANMVLVRYAIYITYLLTLHYDHHQYSVSTNKPSRLLFSTA